MTEDEFAKSGYVYLGVVPAGTTITPEIVDNLFAKRPRHAFDLDLMSSEYQHIKDIADGR
jgi:hypothetical protein